MGYGSEDAGRRGSRPIETASATTSPDNASSGAAAYVIAAVTFALLLATAFGINSCTAQVTEIALEEYGGPIQIRPDGNRYEVDFDEGAPIFDYDGPIYDERGIDEEMMRLLEEFGSESRS